MGIVTSYDPAAYTAIVSIHPEEELTGWLPILAPWVGNGWGHFAPPSIGDQVEVVHAEGSVGMGMVVGRVFDQAHQPIPVQSGEFWLVHKSGSSIKLTNDEKISINGALEIDLSAPRVSIAATENIVITSGGNISMTAQGNITITAAGALTLTGSPLALN